MNIDWFTFTAQIVNFLILVVLLRWLLYGRIMRAMESREDKIAKRSKEAEERRSEAEKKVGEYEDKLREIEIQREELFAQVRREVEAEQERLLTKAREHVDKKRQQWRDAYRRERDELLFELRQHAGHMGVAAAQRTLSQLADADLEKRMCDTFATHLQNLAEEQREQIAQHLGDGEADVSIRSAFEMPDEGRQRLRATVRDAFGHEGGISFETSTDLICGLELDVGGYNLGWNVKEFLHDLKLEFEEGLKSHR